jgi:hypothetical protein
MRCAGSGRASELKFHRWRDAWCKHVASDSQGPGVFVALGSEGSTRLMLVAGVRHLDPPKAVFEAILAGWVRQQQARPLADHTITAKVAAVRRFAAFTNGYPWAWSPADVEEFSAQLRSMDSAGRRCSGRPAPSRGTPRLSGGGTRADTGR